MEDCNLIMIVLTALSVIANFYQAYKNKELKKKLKVDISGDDNKVSTQTHSGNGDNISSIS